MMKLPPVQWLRSFEAAARHLSFTQAANELHVTQSSVSQQVKLLENYLGRSLFTRRVRRLELTESGRQYLPWVQDAFSTLLKGTELFTGVSHRQTLTIRANIAFIFFTLQPLIGDFYQRYPDIKTNLTTMIWEQDYGQGEQHHIEIRFGKGTWADDNLFAFPSQACFPVCSPRVASQLNEIEDLLNFPRWDTQGSVDNWEKWLQFASLDHASESFTHSASTYVVSLEMAKQSMGVALAHPMICQDLLESGELVMPFAVQMPMQDNYYLIENAYLEENSSGKKFCEWMIAQYP